MDPEPAMEEEEPPKWACAACSFENYGSLNECEMCETPRPADGWYDANMDGVLTNAKVVEEIREITACDAETAVRRACPASTDSHHLITLTCPPSK